MRCSFSVFADVKNNVDIWSTCTRCGQDIDFLICADIHFQYLRMLKIMRISGPHLLFTRSNDCYQKLIQGTSSANE